MILHCCQYLYRSLNDDASSMVNKFGLDHVFNVVRQYVNGDAKEYKPTTYALTSIDICGF